MNHKKVEKHLLKATEVYPAYAEAWQLLGEVRLLQANEPGAREALHQALEADPNFIPPYLVMGELEIHAREWQRAVDYLEQAIRLSPDLAHAHYFHALANFYLERDGEAEASLLKVHQSQEAHLFPASHYLLGSIHADRRDFVAAASEYRLFLQTDPPEDLIAEVTRKIEEWEDKGWLEYQTE